MERDSRGRFVKGHSWDDGVLEKISKTKRARSGHVDKVGICECCKNEFDYRPNKHHPTRRFCSHKCVQKYGGRRGIPLSKESRIKMSENMKGDKNHMFVDGSSKRRGAERQSSMRVREWRKSVFKRDDYTCQFCGIRPGNGIAVKLNADHIVPWSVSREKRFDIDNGRTLCVPCHKEVTREWLRKNWKNQYD